MYIAFVGENAAGYGSLLSRRRTRTARDACGLFRVRKALFWRAWDPGTAL